MADYDPGSLFQPSGFNLPQMPQYKKPGMFGGGSNTMSIIAAMLNGFNAGMPGPSREAGLQGLQTLYQGLDAKRQHQQSIDDYNRKRTDDQSDWMTQYNYKAAHPETPDITARIEALNGIEPGLGATYAHNYAANGGGMGPVLTNPMTGQTMVPQAKAPPVQAPPPQAIQDLRSNPGSASQFDEIFGPGSAARVLGAGGPASQAPGGFPY